MSRSTPMGRSETGATGNSGDPAVTKKLPLSDAQDIRGARSNSTSITPRPITEHRVQAASAGVGQPPQNNQVLGPTRADANSNFELDRYRKSADGRTPARQLDEIIKDEPASIKVIRVVDSKTVVNAYTNFMLQSALEADQEKYQVVETFSAYYAFFYGRRPPVYNYSGVLLNDQKHNWAGTFKYMYDNFFRGTVTSELGAQVHLTYGNRVISGFLLNLTMSEDAMNPTGIPFNFSMLVIDHTHAKFSDNFEAFIEQQQKNIAELRQKAQEDIKQLNQNPNPIQNLLKNNALVGKVSSVVTGLKSIGKAQPQSNKAPPAVPTQKDAENKAIAGSIIPSSGNNAVGPSRLSADEIKRRN